MGSGLETTLSVYVSQLLSPCEGRGRGGRREKRERREEGEEERVA